MILHETILRLELILCLTKCDVRCKYPEITHRHTYGVKLGELLQNGGCTRNKGLYEDDGTGKNRNHLDTVDIGTLIVLSEKLRRDKLTRILVVEQHTKRCIDTDDKRGKLTYRIAQCIDDHQGITHVIVLAQSLECPVGAVGVVGVEALLGLVDDGRIEHHAHRDGTKDRTDHNHDRQADHRTREALTRVLYLINIRRDLLTATDREYQDGQGGEVLPVKGRNQVLRTEIHGHEGRSRIDGTRTEHHDDVKDGHDEHAGTGQCCHLLQWIQTTACDVAEQNQDTEGNQLYGQCREGIVRFRITEHSPAQCLQTTGGLTCDVGDMAGPVSPACIVRQLRSCRLQNP